MALVNTLLQGLYMFSDIGIGPSIVQSSRGDEPIYLNTAWTLQVIRSFVLYVVAAAGAHWFAVFYDAPQLAQLVPFVALVTIVSGFNSTRLLTARRHVALGRVTAIDLASQASGIAVMIPWAYVTRDVWALAGGAIVGAVVKVALSHTFLPGIRNRLTLDRECARGLLTFGRWVFLSTLLTFAALQSDRLIFGKLVTLEQLGVYSIAAVWAGVPTAVVTQVSGSVIFPVLSRVHNAGGKLGPALRQARTPWLILAGWMVACLLSGGPALIRFLYDERAKDAQWILQLLAVGAWFVGLESANRMALAAMGRPQWMAVDSSAKLVGMAVMIPLGYHLRGFQGAVAGFAAAEAFSYAASVFGLARVRISGLLLDVGLSAMVIVTSLLGLFVDREMRELLLSVGLAHRLRTVVEGFGIFVAVTAAWGAVFLLARRYRKAQAAPTTPA
jgi:O-antigen/teichoic acid export membrane protein